MILGKIKYWSILRANITGEMEERNMSMIPEALDYYR